MSNDIHNGLNILVTGGSGFLGKAIVEEFLSDQSPVKVSTLRILDLKPYDGLHDARLAFIQGDICIPDDIRKACEGIDIVIHNAAIVDWGTKKPHEVFHANYTGTQCVIEACKNNNVPMLIFTSSLDTVITGKPLRNIDESQPYPAKHLNMYCESKCLA